MIKCAVGPGVQKAISRYFTTYIDDECALDELLLEDWAIKSSNSWNIFKYVTEALEGYMAALVKALLAIDFVLKQLGQGKERYQGDKYMATTCNSS
jgi:hypothetical protein